MLRITAGRVVLADRVAEDVDILIEHGEISELVPTGSAGSGADVLDVQGGWVTPGLIDIHVHGGRRITFNDPDAAPEILAVLAAHGVTSVLATLASAPVEELSAAIAAYRCALPGLHAGAPGARLLGLHLEGPFLSPEQAGAHRLDLLKVPTDPCTAMVLDAADVIRLITVAPELEGGLEFVRQLRARGIQTSIGHSAAGADVFANAVEAGVTHAAHLWSGQSTFRREGPWRVAGLLESCLASDTITAEVIGDGHHLSGELLRIAYACLGQRLCLVSDACSGADLGEGERFTLMDLPCRIEQGAAVVEGKDVFAGSTTYLNDMISMTLKLTGLPVPAIVAMATLVPAHVVRRDDIGRLAPGAAGDVAVFDENWQPQATLIAGRSVFGAIPVPADSN
jgi:N-acetylglucosamine-6-phosphate deacetylase